MRVLTHFTGTVRDFRRWLRQQKCQVYHLAEYREKKKTASAKAAREKNIKNIVTPILPDGAA